jgi:hypothetical protein
VSLVARFVGAKRPRSWIVGVNVLLQTKRATFVFFHLEHTSVVLMLGEGIFGLLHLVVVLVLCIGIVVPLGRLIAENDTARQVTVNVVGLVRLTGNDLHSENAPNGAEGTVGCVFGI